MASAKQIELFTRLTGEKQFPPAVDPATIQAQFSALPQKAASAWIEKALALPDKDDVPAPF